jgi:hypothetical protein
MKMYAISSWNRDIVEKEVTRKTDKFVYVSSVGRDRRESAKNYFDTWGQAKSELVQRAAKQVEMARNKLVGAQKKYMEALSIKPPETSESN